MGCHSNKKRELTLLSGYHHRLLSLYAINTHTHTLPPTFISFLSSSPALNTGSSLFNHFLSPLAVFIRYHLLCQGKLDFYELVFPAHFHYVEKSVSGVGVCVHECLCVCVYVCGCQ